MGGRKDERNDLAADAKSQLKKQQGVLDDLQGVYDGDLKALNNDLA